MPGVHNLDVPGHGLFVFRHRTFRDELWIEAESRRILGGGSDSKELTYVADAIAVLSKLTSDAPDGWDIHSTDIDPLDEDAVAPILKVYGALRKAEAEFRAGAKAKRASMGA